MMPLIESGDGPLDITVPQSGFHRIEPRRRAPRFAQVLADAAPHLAVHYRYSRPRPEDEGQCSGQDL